MNTTTQLAKAGIPAPLKEDIKVEHAVDTFYAAQEAEMFVFAFLKFVKAIGQECLDKFKTTTSSCHV